MAANIRDVAERAGVSVGTVSNVLNHRNNVSPDVAARVREAIVELGYVRNDAARQLRAGRSRSIGLVVPDIGNPFFAEVARGAERRAAEDGMAVLIVTSDGDPTRESSLLELFLEQRVHGVLITPASDDHTVLHRLAEAGTPVVLVDREADDLALSWVAVDDKEGGRLAASHLLSLGRRRLAFVAGPRTTRQVADRLEGAREAVATVSGATLEVLEQPALTVLHGRAAGEALRGRAPADRPDAVFAANDLLAVGVLQALSMMSNVRVPDDIALVGYDDIDFAAATVVPLTSVRQPAATMGYAAVDMLLNAETDAAHQRSIRYQPELVPRQSTVPVD
ncbi:MULTISPECIES: LacI family DNA-binding transcriptional regulator [unclassified Microbacterium]|uniref:LacI family DNA-binding transcriptional regulator n=1 Tax=unclassified Microbacterium TaxID=2609290 RepID=UPI003745F96B